jgi:PAS domain S-box-containing protein
MNTLALDEQRCSNCQRLLFKGVLGIGFIEAKCNRCGTVNLIHNFDGILEGRKNAYILACDDRGDIIVTSKSVEDVLGYTADELVGRSICKLSGSIKPMHPPVEDKLHSLEDWEIFHNNLTKDMIQLTKDGKKLNVNARYYPLHARTGLYTMCVFYAHDI